MSSIIKKDKPLVSVIVPVYNMQEYLDDCVNSIAESLYPAIEIIIADDGSQDDSYRTAMKLAEKWRQRCSIKIIHQKNQGVSSARNNAIAAASGEFILPVDGDDKISPQFIGDAVSVFLKDSKVKVVIPRAEKFGEEHGEWVLPDFSLELLARKNFICATAMYRKSDWKKAGGYCEDFKGFEDWDFWIAMLKEGGNVVKLGDIGFYYRKRKGSKRIADRRFKKEMISKLNQRHPEFFQRVLGGPLRFHRSWSKLFNRLERFYIRLIHGYHAAWQ